MKKAFFFIALLMLLMPLYAQQTDLPTYGYNYQALIRDADGKVVVNTPVQLRFQILNSADQKQYEENHVINTDQFGKGACVVGAGAVTYGLFDTLNWTARKLFLQVWVKIGADGEVDMGKNEIVLPPVTVGSNGDWMNVGDSILWADNKKVGIGISNPKYSLSINGIMALGNRIFPGLNGTEGGGYSLVHFKNGTAQRGGLIRASIADHDDPDAPLNYEASSHSFLGPVSINNQWPSLTFKSTTSGKVLYWEMPGFSGSLYLFDPNLQKYRIFFDVNGNCGIGTLNPQADLDINGTTRTKILEVTGGDVAEARHSTTGEKLRAGSVVVFDETQPGKIRLTAKPYDKKVAGVISGAGKYFAGVCLLQEELSKGAMPVAQIGTVEVLCVGPVEVGDLLTTSEVAGHAMAVTESLRGIGCTIGKATTTLKKGERGLVEMQVEKH